MTSHSRVDDAWAAFAVELGLNLHRLRMERQLSQERLAYKAGLSRFTYQKFEKGQSRPGMPANPTLSSVIALAQALEVEITDLLPSPAPDLLNR